MSAAIDTFFKKFEKLADDVDSFARIRTLVLELAINGKLVANNPEEPPITNGSSSDEPINCTDYPGNWRVHPISAAAKNRSGNSKLIKGKLHNEPAPSLFQGFSASGADVWCDDFEHEGDAIIISAVGARCGKAFKANGKWSAIANTNIVRPDPAYFDFDFAYLLFNDEFFWVRGGSAQPFVKFPPSFARSFAFPPLAEQKRIVAKVDALMAQCDRLEEQLRERDTRQAELARAALARFAEAPTPANLNLLFHDSFTLTPADLRKTILTLAVQGKLVPQNPEDEDARSTIDRAIARRQQTIKTLGLRKKKIDDFADLFEPESLPASWCVERLANLVDPENTISYGVLVPGNDVPDGIPFVRAQDLSLSDHPPKPNKTIAPDIEKPYARTRLAGGEILLCVVGSIGKLGVAPDSWSGANIARAVARIKPIPEVLRDYLLLILQEQSVQSYFTSTTRTLAQPTLNVGMIEQTPIPIPPLAEQRRIVAKVDQLMALVDEWEARLTATRATATRLLDALVAELTAGPGVGPSANGAASSQPGATPRVKRPQKRPKG